MQLWKEILLRALEKNEIDAVENLNDQVVNFIECKSYQALNQIKAVIQDDSLSDKQCFYQIEEIICVLEEIGSNGGARHDF